MKLKLAGIVRMLCHVLSVTGEEGGQLTDEIVDLRRVIYAKILLARRLNDADVCRLFFLVILHQLFAKLALSGCLYRMEISERSALKSLQFVALNEHDSGCWDDDGSDALQNSSTLSAAAAVAAVWFNSNDFDDERKFLISFFFAMLLAKSILRSMYHWNQFISLELQRRCRRFCLGPRDAVKRARNQWRKHLSKVCIARADQTMVQGNNWKCAQPPDWCLNTFLFFVSFIH